MNEEFAQILGQLMRQCSMREYCRCDILEKLRKKEVPVQIQHNIIETLCREGYVSDRRYARAYAYDKSVLSGWGKEKIFFNLRRKHIEETILTDVWGELEPVPQRLDKMRNVIQNKWNSLEKEQPRKRIEKTLRFAVGRGYPYEQILKILEDCKQK